MSEAYLSEKPIPPGERLIVALDVPDAASARNLVDALGESVRFYKIGLELMTSGDYFSLIDWLLARDRKVFCDLKFYDIPATVGAAVRGLSRCGATFLTIHGEKSIMVAAAEAKGELQILAVTVLTSLDRSSLAEMGYRREVSELVVERAAGAIAAGCDGVIASGLEAPELRRRVDSRLIVVTPGIRPAHSRGCDDQRRVVDVAQAFRNGSDYIVMGRPIRSAADPAAAASAVQQTIAEVFSA